ncbi:MAG TPA: hypothetical protein VIH91_10375, partial [Terriglobales bacterium]
MAQNSLFAISVVPSASRPTFSWNPGRTGEVIFLTRVERSRIDSAPVCLDLRDQWRELVALAASREDGEALGCEFFGDCAADVISSPY